MAPWSGLVTVKECQTARLKETAEPTTINDEVGFLPRVMGDPRRL
jgi:hypothetical protein